jgi:hypothetical protein
MNLPLENKLALVTGSSCRIGEVSVADHSTGSISDYFAIQTSEWEGRWIGSILLGGNNGANAAERRAIEERGRTGSLTSGPK